jgi:hypothetical protein
MALRPDGTGGVVTAGSAGTDDLLDSLEEVE